MGIIKKRILAFLIDFFVLAGGIWLALTAFNLMWLFMLDYDSFILAMMLIVFKDCVFKNASLGKKLMRISVYNTHWRRPTFTALIKRTFYSHTIGLCLIVKIRFTNGSFSEFLEWEKKTGLVHSRICSVCGEEEEANHNIPAGSVTCTDCGADIIN